LPFVQSVIPSAIARTLVYYLLAVAAGLVSLVTAVAVSSSLTNACKCNKKIKVTRGNWTRDQQMVILTLDIIPLSYWGLYILLKYTVYLSECLTNTWKVVTSLLDNYYLIDGCATIKGNYWWCHPNSMIHIWSCVKFQGESEYGHEKVIFRWSRPKIEISMSYILFSIKFWGESEYGYEKVIFRWSRPKKEISMSYILFSIKFWGESKYDYETLIFCWSRPKKEIFVSYILFSIKFQEEFKFGYEKVIFRWSRPKKEISTSHISFSMKFQGESESESENVIFC
jgi:hypothetical protein